jgi:hypothetical protein
MTVHQMVSFIWVTCMALTCKQLALKFTNRFCCDKHGDGFNLAVFFPGKFQTAETLIFIDQAVNAASSRPKYRPMKEREPLRAALYSWRAHTHENDPLRRVRQISWILANTEIEVICKAPRKSLANINQLKTLLDASSDWVDEWGQKIIDEICSFNATM